MQLCFGCLHAFPESALTPVDFEEETQQRFGSVRAAMAQLLQLHETQLEQEGQSAGQLRTTSGAGRQAVAAMEEDLRALGRALRKELQGRDTRLEQLRAQIGFLVEEEARLRQLLETPPPAPRVRPPRAKAARAPYASGLLERFLAASRHGEKLPQPPELATTSAGGVGRRAPEVRENRFGAVVSGSSQHQQHHQVSPAHHRSPQHAAESVAAMLFSIVESVVVRTRAASGALWIVLGSARDDIAAPIVVAGAPTPHGQRGARKAGAPHRVTASSSLQGLCAATGITINVLHQHQPDSSPRSPAAAQDALSPVLAPSARRSQLFSPIFTRYGAATRETAAVLQLLAAPTGAPFTPHDESVAAAACDILSHIISTYGSIVTGDVALRQYDPTPLVRHAQYFAEMDQNPARKGAVALDEFATVPRLVFRSGQREGGTRGGRGREEAANEQVVTKQGVLQGAGPAAEVHAGLRDLHRYTNTLEASWKKAVNAQTDAERENVQLRASLDAAKQALSDMRRALDNETLRSAVAAATSSAALHPPLPTAGKAPAASIATGGGVGLAGRLSAADIDDIESETVTALARAQPKSLKRPTPPRGVSGGGGGRTFITENS